MQIAKIFPLALLFLLASGIAQAQFQVRVRFGEIPNLTYQLDCVSDQPISCSEGNFRELWNREFLKSDEDRRMIEDWKRLRETYAQDFKLTDGDGNNYFVSIFEKLRIAGLQSESVADYSRRLDLLTAPVDRDSFERIVRHFQPRFNDWWRREAVKSGDEFARQTDLLLRSPRIAVPLRQFYAFYAPVLPENYELTFNLFYIPDYVREPTNGQQIQNYSIAEFQAKERPEERIDVIVHELSHFLFENMSSDNEEALRKRFYDLNRASAIPAYNLLNESLATTFGNGIISRSVTPAAQFSRYAGTPKSFYNNEAIDRAAKVNLLWMDDWLKNGRTINDPAFVEQYVSNLEKSFGADLEKPKLYLSEMFLMVDEKIGSLRREVRQKLEVASFYASEGSWNEDNLLENYTSNPQLNALFIAHSDNIGELVKKKIINESQAKEIADELKTNGEVLYNSERGKFTYNYIIVTDRRERALKLVEQLARAKQFKGIYKSGS